MDCSYLLSRIGIVGETVNHSKWNDAEPGARRAGWLRCMETIFVPFWFWFAPVCEVPFTVVQIVIFTQIGVRDVTERSVLETLDAAAFRRYFLSDSPSRPPAFFPQEGNSLRSVLLLWKKEGKYDRILLSPF